MTIDVMQVLQFLVPGCQCAVWENDFNKVVWNDPRPMPTAKEYEAGVAAFQVEQEKIDANAVILAKINALEAAQTPRRIRDAVLGTDDGWLANLESEIAALRKNLI